VAGILIEKLSRFIWEAFIDDVLGGGADGVTVFTDTAVV